MKFLYQSIFFLSSLVILSAYAIPSTMPLGRRLLSSSDKWEIVITHPHPDDLRKYSAAAIKAALIESLSYPRDSDFKRSAIIAAIFSLLGWRRESYILKRAKIQDRTL